MGKYKSRNEKGITLIALIVTIIVLLILAGIALSVIRGNNGIINRSSDAKNSTEIKSEMELVAVASNNARGKDKYGNLTLDRLQKELDYSAGENKTKVTEESDNDNNIGFKVTFLNSQRYYFLYNEEGEAGAIFAGYVGIDNENGILNVVPKRKTVLINTSEQVEGLLRTFSSIDKNNIKMFYGWSKSSVGEPSYTEIPSASINGDGYNKRVLINYPNETGEYYLTLKATINGENTITKQFGQYKVVPEVVIPEYIVTFRKGKHVASIGEESITTTGEVTLPSITPNEQCEVLGWFNGDILVGTPGSKIDVTEDITLTAIAKNTKAPTVVVAREDFNTFRWTATDVVPITGYQISKNSAIPSATGTGWTNGDINTGTYDISEEGTYYVYVKNEDGIVGQGMINAYTVSRDQGTGTTLTTKIDSSSGEEFTNTTNVLDGTTIYVAGSLNTGYSSLVLKNKDNVISAGNQTITSNSIFKSSATASTFTITLDKQSGTGGTSTIYETYGTKYSLTSGGNAMTTSENPVTVPTRDMYEFQGYYTQANGEGTQYIDKNGHLTSNASTTNFTSNGTLYAYWTRPVFELALDNQGANTPGTDKIYLTYSTKYSLTRDGDEMTTTANPIIPPTKNGYAFMGYYNTSAETGGTQYINAKGYKTSSASLTGFTANGTLYARWQEVTLKRVETSTSSTTSKFLETTIERRKIKSISFANSISGHTIDGTTCFDVSSITDAGQVLVWIANTDGNGYYDIVIGQNGGVKANPDSSYLFGYVGYTPPTFTINFTNFYTENVTNMKYMFYYCGYTGMTSLNLGSNFDTSSVQNMQGMFSNCGYIAMTSLNLGDKFDTSSVTTYMSSMFSSCGYTAMTSLDLGDKFDTSSVNNMYAMFRYCGYTAMTSLDLGDKFDTSGVTTNMNDMFSYCGYTAMTSLDLGDKFDTSNVTSMNYMFDSCGFTAMTSLDLGDKFDTSNVQDMNYMFRECGFKAMTYLDLGDKFNTSNVTNMAHMFDSCGFRAMTSLDLGDKFDTSNVTNMDSMFYYCGYTAMTSLDLENKFDTSNATDMSRMFERCGYTVMTSLDLGNNFDTSNVQNMKDMFSNCGYTAMTSLDLGDKFDTTNVTDMEDMFYECGWKAMTSLDISAMTFPSTLTSYANIFSGCGLSNCQIYVKSATEKAWVENNKNTLWSNSNIIVGHLN